MPMMEKLTGRVRYLGAVKNVTATHHLNYRRINVNSSSLQVGGKIFTYKQVRNWLQKGKGSFRCGYYYRLQVLKNGSISLLAKIYLDRQTLRLTIPKEIVAEIKRWAKRKRKGDN